MKNRKNRPVNGKVFRSGVYSTAILAAAILLAVLVNLVVRALPSKYTEFDLSEAKMYTLGDSSVQLAQSLHLAEDVAGQDDRVGLAQFPDQFTDADDLRRVQADRGLIQNDQLRAAQKSLRNAHTLAVALGQAADEPGHHLIQPGAPGGLLHLLAALGFFDPLELGRKV